nr:enoyl-CoA hydratase/isomerase family protein [uncultured Steroidobacter sp.]
MTEAVLVQRHGAVASVIMNRPDRRNALSPELYLGLSKTVAALQEDPEVRALVLTGGPHFCAGGDIGGLEAPGGLEFRREMLKGQQAVRSLIGGRLPVIAAVEGNAYGAGLSLAMACDFVVADENTAFCAVFPRLGLVPDYGLLWSLPQRVGIAKAREMMMFGEVVRGQRALDCKLIDRLVPIGTVQETALAMAQQLASAAPGTIATIKAALSRMPVSLDNTLAWEADTQAVLAHSEDFAEGLRAFREKRPPTFNNR